MNRSSGVELDGRCPSDLISDVDHVSSRGQLWWKNELKSVGVGSGASDGLLDERSVYWLCPACVPAAH